MMRELAFGASCTEATLAWRIPGMGEPGGLPSKVLHRVGHDRSDSAAAAAALKLVQFGFCLRHPLVKAKSLVPSEP